MVTLGKVTDWRIWHRVRGAGEAPADEERYKRANALFADYRREVEAWEQARRHGEVLPFVPATDALAAAPDVQSALVVIATAFLLGPSAERLTIQLRWPLRGLAHALFARIPRLDERDVAALLDLLISSPNTWTTTMPVHELARALKRSAAERPLPDETAARIRCLRDAAAGRQLDAPGRAALETLIRLLPEEAVKHELIDTTDDWGAAAADALAAFDPGTATAWRAILGHAAEVGRTEPSERWRQTARRLTAELGEERFARIASDWLLLLRRPSSGRTRSTSSGSTVPAAMLTGQNGALLRGLAWMCATLEERAPVSVLGDAASVCLTRVQRGARSATGGKGCLQALAAIGGTEAIAQLVRLQQRVPQKTSLALIERLLRDAAERAGMTSDELADLAAPAFDLVDGRARRSIGVFTAEIAVERGKAALAWFDAEGKPRKSAPAEVKRDHAPELSELKRTAKEIEALLGAQRLRFERCYLAEREWAYPAWRERLLDHPLLGLLARRLIWSFDVGEASVLGCWLDGRLVGLDDRPLAEPGPGARVRLFHPVQADPETIRGWQLWLERHRVTQPFKQAHREIYPLTDAERTTERYSLRYGGHILHANRFAGLCQQRGWSYGAYYELKPSAAFELKGSGLRVHFAHEQDATARDYSAHGDDRFVTTGRVTFVRGQGGRAHAVRLDEVPPILFSEAMRDADLFVGVCSIGADPSWQDRPGFQMPRFAAYVHDRSFGELPPSAHGRRELLERLLPGLGLNQRCRLDDRYLIVRGDARTYKIHLGSGNILMEPDNAYLCIVPRRERDASDASDRIYLPFEGDATLSLILSKALLLARDTAITDPTISRQIKR